MPTTFHPVAKVSGSNQTTINVGRNGKPFGQLWTFTANGETHGWHAKTLNGSYKLFDGASKSANLTAAKAWMKGA
jgi:hypothetical protein